MHLPLYAVAAALALVVGMSRSDVSAAVLPDRSSSTESTKVPASNARTRGGTNRPSPHAWCTPWFSGLVQTIKKNKQREFFFLFRSRHAFQRDVLTLRNDCRRHILSLEMHQLE